MPAQPAPVSPTLLFAWESTVNAAPTATALIDGTTHRIYTRADLDSLAAAFAARLPPAVAGQRVTFALPNGPAWFATFLGLLRARAVPVPLDPSEPVPSQLALARAAMAAFAVLPDGLVGVPVSASTSDISASTHSASSASGAGLGVPTPTFPPDALPSPAPSARAALCKLTSGSTGTPRALAFSHAQMLADGRQVCASMGIRATDRNLAVIPFGHSYGLGNLVVPLLSQGTALICADTPLPHSLAATTARHQPTIFPAVPALLRALADADLPGHAFASLRTVISAGSPLPPTTATAFHQKFGLIPHGFYGSSETGGIAYDRVGTETLAGTSVGTALEGVTITPLPDQRIHVSSPAVCAAACDSARHCDSAGHAGHTPADHARLEPDGRLVLLGRTGRLHKIGGRRLDLAELEHDLRQLPGLADAFVTPHPEEPEQLAAALATSLTPLALRQLLRAHLAPWKIPRRVVPVEAFPLTQRGKPDATALRALLTRPPAAGPHANSAAPSSASATSPSFAYSASLPPSPTLAPHAPGHPGCSG